MAPCCVCKCCTGFLTCGCSTFANFVMLMATGGLVVIQPSYHKKKKITVPPDGMAPKNSKSNCIDSNRQFIAVFAVRWVLCLGVHTCAWFLRIHSDTTSLLLLLYLLCLLVQVFPLPRVIHSFASRRFLHTLTHRSAMLRRVCEQEQQTILRMDHPRSAKNALPSAQAARVAELSMARESSDAVLEIIKYFENIGTPDNRTFTEWDLYRPKKGVAGGADLPCRVVFSMRKETRLNVQELYNMDHTLRAKIRDIFFGAAGVMIVETGIYSLGTTDEKTTTLTPTGKRLRSA
jgi:hypothetical protein